MTERGPEPPFPRGSDAGPAGSARRWVVWGTASAVVAGFLFGFALTLQTALPMLGLGWVFVSWVVLLLVARWRVDARRRNRALAWIMGVMTIGALGIAVALYFSEAMG